MKILVTGGLGLIGSNLCNQLIKEGNKVICVDNSFTGSKRNVDHLLDHNGFELIDHDITVPIYLEIDQIYN